MLGSLWIVLLVLMGCVAPWSLGRSVACGGDVCPLDKLLDIVRDWQPGKYSKSYLCHLVELIHTTLKTLEWYTKRDPEKAGATSSTEANLQDDEKAPLDKDLLDRVNAARNFDLGRYFGRLATCQ